MNCVITQHELLSEIGNELTWEKPYLLGLDDGNSMKRLRLGSEALRWA